jgi:hypothetical protein
MSGNSPLSCPQITEAAVVAVVEVVTAALVVVLATVVLVEVVLVVAVLAVVVVRRAAFFTFASEELVLDPQADTRTSPERTKQESRRFCIPLLCIMYTINTTHLGHYLLHSALRKDFRPLEPVQNFRFQDFLKSKIH